MRHWILGALAAALVLPGGIAAAQGGEPVDHPLAVRLGAMWPTKSEVRNAAGKSWFNAGLDYIFARTSEGNDWIGSLDYGTTSSINYWALQALYMWRNTGAISSSEKFSFGLGAGAYFLDTNTNSTQSEFGIPLVADWDLTQTIFLEAKYHWVLTESKANAFGLTLGYRF